MHYVSKLFKNYQELSKPKKTTIWFGICQFLQKGIGMLTTPIFTRFLSTSEYGTASNFIAWTNIVTPVITLSTWRGMMNLFAKDEDRDDVFSSCITMSIIISLAFSFIIIVFQDFIVEKTSINSIFLWLVVIYGVSQNIIFAWNTKLQYEYNFKPLIICTLVNTAITAFGGALFVLLISRTAISKITPQVLASLGVVFWIIISCRKSFRCFYNKSIWRFSFGFSLPLIPHYLSEVVLQSSDRIMIGSICSSSDVAIYSIAYSVGNLISLAIGAVNTSFVPYQYQKIKEQDYKRLSVVTNYIISFVAIVMVLIMMFGREIVLIFGGMKYIESVELIYPICLGVFFNYLFQIFARVQEYYEQKYTITIASVSCAILNILLNYYFIKLYDYRAAAYTTFVCYFIFCILHYFFYRMCCKKNLRQEIYDIKGLVVISVLLIFSSIIIYFLNKIVILKYMILCMVIFMLFISKNKILIVIKKFKD